MAQQPVPKKSQPNSVTFLHQDRHALPSAVELVGGQHRIGDILAANSTKKNGCFFPWKRRSPNLGFRFHGSFRLELLKFGGVYSSYQVVHLDSQILTLGIPTKRGSTVPRHIEISVLSTAHVGIYWKLTTQYAASFETPSRESVVRVWIQIESWISSLGSFSLVLIKFLTPLFQLNMIEHHTVERPFELTAPRFTAKVAAFKQ